ncbi:hypothetical protein O6H91_01G110700 [Diphasiastrum complanatum]|uniref:Uncharacterized protein n=3 Tax=Diphasiastrum complanatum TaxID=34168 RepID=A0ACC2EUN5_DIPCM|nr:hypothetical protein O6H91_01G108000 [Diphasiastrum complanatum]KAJ7570231.1 hypothetical protein O6H91_01G110700 [Diphasiastrum complanatum]KAJ7570232.1 hypothetical protein O6H91_01G110700 [Diphasiastrum complanatum]
MWASSKFERDCCFWLLQEEQDDIKAAYRRMARRYHPDVCAREEAQECTKRFIVLQEAYETLSDPWRRASYDRAMTNSLYSCSGWSMEEGDQLNWKLRWEEQLAVLKTRSAVNARENSDSWGARMRRRRQQQEQQ